MYTQVRTYVWPPFKFVLASFFSCVSKVPACAEGEVFKGINIRSFDEYSLSLSLSQRQEMFFNVVIGISLQKQNIYLLGEMQNRWMDGLVINFRINLYLGNDAIFPRYFVLRLKVHKAFYLFPECI